MKQWGRMFGIVALLTLLLGARSSHARSGAEPVSISFGPPQRDSFPPPNNPGWFVPVIVTGADSRAISRVTFGIVTSGGLKLRNVSQGTFWTDECYCDFAWGSQFGTEKDTVLIFTAPHALDCKAPNGRSDVIAWLWFWPDVGVAHFVTECYPPPYQYDCETPMPAALMCDNGRYIEHWTYGPDLVLPDHPIAARRVTWSKLKAAYR